MWVHYGSWFDILSPLFNFPGHSRTFHDVRVLSGGNYDPGGVSERSFDVIRDSSLLCTPTGARRYKARRRRPILQQSSTTSPILHNTSSSIMSTFYYEPFYNLDRLIDEVLLPRAAFASPNSGNDGRQLQRSSSDNAVRAFKPRYVCCVSLHSRHNAHTFQKDGPS